MKNIKRWVITKVPRWEEFKSFFQLKFVIYLITWFTLIPIIVNLLSKAPKELKLTFAKPELIIPMSLPFSWEIMWFSSLSFFIAYILYILAIPKFVRKYNNYKDYEKYGHSPRNLVYQAVDIANTKKFIERMCEKKFITTSDTIPDDDNNPSVTKEQTIYYWKFKDITYKFGMPILNESDVTESEKEIFWEIFGRFSEKFLLVRILIIILLILSLLLFGYVLIHHIQSGYEYAMENI